MGIDFIDPDKFIEKTRKGGMPAVGCFARLLLAIAENGPLPDDDAALSATLGISEAHWRDVYRHDVLKMLDKTPNGRWRSDVLIDAWPVDCLDED